MTNSNDKPNVTEAVETAQEAAVGVADGVREQAGELVGIQMRTLAPGPKDFESTTVYPTSLVDDHGYQLYASPDGSVGYMRSDETAHVEACGGWDENGGWVGEWPHIETVDNYQHEPPSAKELVLFEQAVLEVRAKLSNK